MAIKFNSSLEDFVQNSCSFHCFIEYDKESDYLTITNRKPLPDREEEQVLDRVKSTQILIERRLKHKERLESKGQYKETDLDIDPDFES